MKHINIYVKIALVLLFFSSVIVFQTQQKSQLDALYMNGENTEIALEHNIQNGINAVKELNIAAKIGIAHKDKVPLDLALTVKKCNPQGNFTSDATFGSNVEYEDKANISGFGGLKTDKATLQEMEMSLSLIPYFKLIKEENINYAWVYYFSNKNFVSLYPFASSKEFALLPAYKNKPLFQYATPRHNPKKKFFVTPLYIDNGGLGLMVTLGMPVYDRNQFMGVTELDMTLKSQSAMLERLDYLNNKSLIANQENEVIAIHNIAEPNTQKIIHANSVIDPVLLHLPDSIGELTFIDGKYVYSKTFKNVPWKFIYYKNAYEVLLQSFLSALPLLLSMLFLFYFNRLYQRIHVLSVELKEQASRDYMTGCYNRRYFFETAQPIFLNNVRKKSPLAVIMIDIDQFKQINDTYGHDVGDIAIKEIPKILSKTLRQSDLLGRLGGEEFGIVIENITLDDVKKLFERVRTNFETNTIYANGVELHYTLSFGIAYGSASSFEEMMRIADEALYDSKNNGRNQVTIKTC